METNVPTDARLLAAFCAFLLTAVVIALIVAGVHTNAHDRRYLTARVEACRTIEDPALRADCIGAVER